MNHRLIMLAVVLVLLSGLWGACGKKGPPVLPQTPPPQEVSDLQVRVTGTQALLQWTRPAANTAGNELLQGFTVERSRTALSDPPCPTCPLAFERIGNVWIAIPDDTRFTYQAPLEKGYRYIFRVMGYGPNNLTAPESNHVQVEYP